MTNRLKTAFIKWYIEGFIKMSYFYNYFLFPDDKNKVSGSYLKVLLYQ